MTRRFRGVLGLGLLITAGWLGSRPATADDAAVPTPIANRIRIERYGLTTPDPPHPGKRPVILIPGLLTTPRIWEPMIVALSSDPAIAESYQFWTFGYSTGDPIPYSARLLRAAIDDARARLDPDRRDPALDHVTLVGHSMGGLVAKLTAVDSGERLWRLVSDQPPDRLAGDPADVVLARDCLIFHARPEVREIVYIATPHGGGMAGRELLHDVADRFVLPPISLLTMRRRLLDANPPDFFRPPFGGGLMSSIDELRHGSPILQAMRELRPATGVARYSIIAVKNGPMGPGGDDGVVTYADAHLDDADAETIVAGGHLCQDSPAVLAEVRRILLKDRTRLETAGR